MGFPIIPYGDTKLPNNTIESECPNDDCVDYGTEYKGTEVGGYVKIGTRFFVDNLYLNLIGGATVVTESEIVQSPATDRYYEASSDTISNALYGVGLGFFPEVLDWQLVFMVDYDNRRGVTGSGGLLLVNKIAGRFYLWAALAAASAFPETGCEFFNSFIS